MLWIHGGAMTDHPELARRQRAVMLLINGAGAAVLGICFKPSSLRYAPPDPGGPVLQLWSRDPKTGGMRRLLDFLSWLIYFSNSISNLLRLL